MHAFYLILAIGGTVNACMFAAAYAARCEAIARYGPRAFSPQERT